MKRVPRLIAVVHLPPLVGAPNQELSLEKTCDLAVNEARLFEKSGFDSVVLENFGDRPFFKTEVPTETVSAMSVIANEVRRSVKISVGLNFLRNAALQAMSVATVTECDFIRVNVLSGVAATDQGVIEGCAAELLRLKKSLQSNVEVFADVLVKHAQPLSGSRVDLAIEEAVGRGGARAVILSGETTGREVNPDRLFEASKVAKHLKTPLLIGSGANPDNIRELLRFADGAIVSSCLRKNKTPGAPLVPEMLKRFVKSAHLK